MVTNGVVSEDEKDFMAAKSLQRSTLEMRKSLSSKQMEVIQWYPLGNWTAPKTNDVGNRIDGMAAAVYDPGFLSRFNKLH